MLGANTVLPSEARALGLIDEVATPDQLMSRALYAADRLTSIPAISFALTKRAYTEPLLKRVDAARSLNDEALAAWQNPAVLTRIRAYVEQTVGKK